MLTLNSKKHLLVTSIALALAACGGGGGGSKDPGATKGVAVDGYLVGSTVVCDTNGNGIADEGEQTTTTGEGGVYAFNRFCNANTFLTGGTNVVSDSVSYTFTGLLKAPKGSSVITPITTLIAEIAGEDATTEEIKAAEKTVAKLLGLPENTEITKLDPVAEANKPDGDSSLLKTTIALQQVINEVAKLYTAPGTSDQAVNQLVISALATKLTEDNAANLIENGTVSSSHIEDVITEVNNKPEVADRKLALTDLVDVTEAIQTSANKVIEATNLDEIEEAATEVQNPANPPADTSAPAFTRYLLLSPNTGFKINNTAIDFTHANFTNLDTATPQVVSDKIQTLAFTLEPQAGYAFNDDVSIGFIIEGTGLDNRVVEVQIDKVTLTIDEGIVSATIPSSAKVYVYARQQDGTKFNLELNNATSDIIESDESNNTFTLNYENILNRVKNSTQLTGSQKNLVDELINLEGRFNFIMAVNKLSIRSAADKPLTIKSAGVTNAASNNGVPVIPAATGFGVEGVIQIGEPSVEPPVSNPNALVLPSTGFKINSTNVIPTNDGFTDNNSATEIALNDIIRTISLPFSIKGNYEFDDDISLGLIIEASDGENQRVIEIQITDIAFEVIEDEISLSPVDETNFKFPAYVYVKNNDNTKDWNLTAGVSLDAIYVEDNTLIIDYDYLTEELIDATADSELETEIENLYTLQNGQYNIIFAIDGLNIQKSDGTPLPIKSSGVTDVNSDSIPLLTPATGFGFEGLVNIQRP